MYIYQKAYYHLISGVYEFLNWDQLIFTSKTGQGNSYESQEYNVHLFAKNLLNRWDQVIMMVKEDDLCLFG